MRPAARARFARLAVASTVTVGLGVVAVACGGGDSDAGTGSSGAPSASMSPVERGESIARSEGCAGCHGQDFDGAAGPGWIGLAGSEVTLVDGTTTTADHDYLVRAIADPGADIVAGFSLKMPANNLTDDEIADIVAFIESLTDG